MSQLSDFDQKLLIGIGTGILGFVSAYVLDLIKKGREPRKELSYEIQVPDPLIDVSPNVSEKVKVKYGSEDIKNLYFVVFRVENTGNRVIKTQHLRFQFDNKSQLLEDIFEPDPPQEYAVTRFDDNQKFERRYSIGHFERGSKLGIRFVLSSENPPHVQVFPKNDEGDVAFELRSQKKAADEMHQVTRFFFLVLLWYVFPSVLSVARLNFGQELIARTLHVCFDVVFFFLLLPLLRPVSTAFARILLAKKNSEGRAVSIRGDAKAIIAETVGTVHFGSDRTIQPSEPIEQMSAVSEVSHSQSDVQP